MDKNNRPLMEWNFIFPIIITCSTEDQAQSLHPNLTKTLISLGSPDAHNLSRQKSSIHQTLTDLKSHHMGNGTPSQYFSMPLTFLQEWNILNKIAYIYIFAYISIFDLLICFYLFKLLSTTF